MHHMHCTRLFGATLVWWNKYSPKYIENAQRIVPVQSLIVDKMDSTVKLECGIDTFHMEKGVGASHITYAMCHGT